MEIVHVVCPKKEDSPDNPDPTPSLEKKMCCVRRITSTQGRTGITPKVTETPKVKVLKTLYERHIEGKHVPFQRYVIPPKNVKRLKRINLIL